MGILSDTAICAAMRDNGLVIDPFTEANLQPCSVDLRLAGDFYRPDRSSRRAVGDTFTLEPGQFWLASTIESITLPTTLTARVEGKSTFARMGIQIHMTAGFIDPGFKGQITLELYSVSRTPVQLVVGEPIAQIAFFKVIGTVKRPYGSKGLQSHYQNQQGATPAWRTR